MKSINMNTEKGIMEGKAVYDDEGRCISGFKDAAEKALSENNIMADVEILIEEQAYGWISLYLIGSTDTTQGTLEVWPKDDTPQDAILIGSISYSSRNKYQELTDKLANFLMKESLKQEN